MRAIILAAGRGSRMQTLTANRPKCLIKLRGKTLLQRQIDALRAAGVVEIGIVTGYRKEDLMHYGLTQFHNPRWNKTNMVSSLACAAQWLEDGPCIVSYSDIFYHSSAVEMLMKLSSPIAITYDPNWLNLWKQRFDDPLTDAETFLINEDQVLLEIGSKPAELSQIQGQFMGLIRLMPKGWSEIVRIRKSLNVNVQDKMDSTGILQKIIEMGRVPIRAIAIESQWGEIDTESDLAYYESIKEELI
ncbi:MAG: nucleotidyl transferase [Rhodospirillaceae bacterium]|nr:nucleotidyl transferase [Rhodospirillaceae bacterium]|tara:strand:+ start:598 stop:1332 length:735 start_codon:yes stop_codon:yes gene_type:complete